MSANEIDDEKTVSQARVDWLETCLDKSQIDNERLRAALQSIVDWNDGPASGLNWAPLMIMARAALDAGQ